MKENIIFYIVFIFYKVLSLLPKKIRLGFFFLLSRFIYLIAIPKNRVIKANLDLVFDNKLKSEEIKEIQKYSYYNMLLWLNSQIENFSANEEEMKKNFTFENREIIDNLIKENKKIILISAHFGNIEAFGYGINKYVTKIVHLVRELNSKKLDEFVQKSRTISGIEIAYKKNAMKQMVNALKNNKVISMIVDQSVNSRDGVEVKFLGKKANQTNSVAKLSRRFDAYIVPMAIFNQENGTYKIKFYNPIEPIKTDNQEDDIKVSTQLQADALSKIILEDPKQWFWPHKRFKVHYREIYG